MLGLLRVCCVGEKGRVAQGIYRVWASRCHIEVWKMFCKSGLLFEKSCVAFLFIYFSSQDRDVSTFILCVCFVNKKK